MNKIYHRIKYDGGHSVRLTVLYGSVGNGV